MDRPEMPWRVVEVKPIGQFRLFVRFCDGLEGEINIAGLVRSPAAGVFAQLADPVKFQLVFIERGVVTWPGEIDLAPDSMYLEIQKNGIWVLN